MPSMDIRIRMASRIVHDGAAEIAGESELPGSGDEPGLDFGLFINTTQKTR